MQTDVLVIGGGATGAGLAWDLALRGVRTVLVEMGDLATGTSGRYHGLLHSGGRYAVKDAESAKECIDENMILRRIAPHVLEDTGGFFILCPGDGEEYVGQWLAACAAVGISTHEISVEKARQREPVINPHTRAVFEVPDGTCDSWDLAHALQKGAEAAGAVFLTYHKLDSFHMQDNRVTGARIINMRTGEALDIECAMVANATGPWAAEVAGKAGAHFNMKLSRGAMLAFNVRWVNTVINRLRAPGDGDIFVPVGTVSVAGTTSVKTDDPGDNRVEPWEVQRVLSETEIMTPGISRARVLRAWGGVRPLYDPGVSNDGRGAARTFVVLDHSERDGIEGILSITGGKLTTFRLMAEKTADMICAKLGVIARSTTAETPLPTLEKGRLTGFHELRHRLDKLEHGDMPGPLLCECELVTEPQIVEALGRDDVFTLHDLRRDLRLGMGPCQGGFCSYRAAAVRHEILNDTPAHTDELLSEFVERRFGGMRPLLWGHNLRQALLAEQIYGRILRLSRNAPKQTVLPSPPAPLPMGEGRKTAPSPKIVVVGAGLAGLTAALTAVESGARVELVAFGQGALIVQPGWIEIGEVERLAQTEGHPYRFAADSLSAGLSVVDSVIGLQTTGQPIEAITAMGKTRQVAYGAGGTLRQISKTDKVLIVGVIDWRDFYARLIADTLNSQGYQAEALEIMIAERIGRFDEWPLDIAHLLDTPEGLAMLVNQVRPNLNGATVVGFPAVLGFKRETRGRIAEALGVPIFEIPTLPPSIPGMRLYEALREALLARGGRMVMGPRVLELAKQGDRVIGVQTTTANNRPRTVYGDAVILAMGGLYGGGLESDYQFRVWETVAGLPVANVPENGAWFTNALLDGTPQPIHRAGVVTDSQLRPLDADGNVIAPNVYVAGRMLAGYSPISEGCTEGVDIATGAHAAIQAILAAKEEKQIN